MPIDKRLLERALRARERMVELQHEGELAQVSYHHAIRRLHASGASLREVADALSVSYQRVHQVVDASTGKAALKASAAAGMCSFCGRDESLVRGIVSGPGIFICERCADVAGGVLIEGEARSVAGTAIVSLASTQTKARCGFCGSRRGQVDGIAEAPSRPAVGKLRERRGGVRICACCVELCHEILAERLR